MCIRDRPWGILITGVGGTGVVTIGALLGMAAHLEGKGISCLLYTSDAADERSSVDLGGRRLIKKKQRTHMR